jgi:hypothetical protein
MNFNVDRFKELKNEILLKWVKKLKKSDAEGYAIGDLVEEILNALKSGKYDICIPGLYYRYKKTEDSEIKNYLSKIKLVKKEHKGVESIFGYYPLSEESMKKIMENPRNISLTFDAEETLNEALPGLEEYKTIVFLIKSTSRFFLKPDIGEVFDQINFHDLFEPYKFSAICVNLKDYETLDGTDGEHFLMTATLLREIDAEKKEAIKKLHEL